MKSFRMWTSVVLGIVGFVLTLVGVRELIPGGAGFFGYLWSMVFGALTFLCAIDVFRRMRRR